jgi:hypothetical protein
MLLRDRSPESLAFALPLLHLIAKASAGTEQELACAGVLARTLMDVGRTAEAEPMLRDLIARAAAQGNYRVASAGAGELFALLWESGRLEEALRAVDGMGDYKRKAGLGPWTQLADDVRRLRVLVVMGRNDEVLKAVDELRLRMDALLLQSDAKESIDPWTVREGLLEAGRDAARNTERWATALALNAEVVKARKERGTDPLRIAEARVNDYEPLLRMQRYNDARGLLMSCRAVAERERSIEMLSIVYTALADLEDKTGNRAAAVRFEEVSLGYAYQVGHPEECAVSHHNLANYLERQADEPAHVLAHRLAAAAIRLQTQSGLLPATVRNLARSDLPPGPPSFAEVAKRVEAIEGVRFQALFDRLPRTVPDGDGAIAAVWQMVADEKRRRAEQTQKRDAVLASAPEAVRAAFELEGDEFNAALRVALAELPDAESAALLQRLREGGLIRVSTVPDVAKVLNQFEPLLQGIAAAVKDESLRTEIEPLLADLGQKGARLTEAVHCIWAGERGPEVLIAGLNELDTALIRRVLEILNP